MGHPNRWEANNIVRSSHHCPKKVIALIFQAFSTNTRFMAGDGTKIRFWKICGGGINLCVHNFQDFTKSSQLEISPLAILGDNTPFSWNLFFHRNLTELESEDLEKLMTSLSSVHLFSSVLDA